MFSPFGNQTANTSAVWHPEPRGRGTFNILSSCLTTMILCVWTAVHLNIPGHDGGTKQSLLRKPGWLLLALLAPEIVAWNAWEQRRTARELTNDFIEAFEPGLPTRLGWIQRLRNAIKSGSANSEKPFADPEQECTSNGRSKITLVHGFYAAMGGYVIQTHLMDGQYPISGQGRLTLTPDGIQWLLIYCPGIFPDLTEAEILDKSKASTLVKTLTCLQAFWFCLQCVVRLTMNTSISLLELNVFGHCTCTFIIYAIWWNKPLDVSEPTLLKVENGPEIECLLAVLCSYTSRTVPRLPYPLTECAETGHKYSAWSQFLVDDDDHWPWKYARSLETVFSASGPPVCGKDNEFGCGHGLYADNNEKQVDKCAGLHLERLKQLLNLDASIPQIEVSMYEDVATSKVRLAIGTKQTGLTYYLSRTKLEPLNFEDEESEQLDNLGLIPGEPKGTTDRSYHLERSFLLWLAFDEYRHTENVKLGSWVRRPPRPFVDRSHDWTFRLSPEESTGSHLWSLGLSDLLETVVDMVAEWIIGRVIEWLAMSAAAFIYGGLHLLAWDAPFHAPICGLLWKISGITTASLAIFPFLILLFLACTVLAWAYDDRRLRCLGLSLTILTLLGILSFILLYIFARVYLVVESFLSLAYLPESVLVTPKFSLYFPHIQ